MMLSRKLGKVASGSMKESARAILEDLKKKKLERYLPGA